MSRVLFISPTYVTPETENAFQRHIESIDRQSGDWMHVVVNDASPVPIESDSRQHQNRKWLHNDKREGSPLAATMRGLSEFVYDDDIVAIVDGDDWLLVDNIPELLNKAYEDGTEIAWSNFLMSDGRPGWGMDFSEIVHPRDQWVSSHLKTFRGNMLKRIDDALLRNGDGKYVRFAGDCALYWALLEKCYKRKHIPRMLYCYNLGNPMNELTSNKEKVLETEAMLKNRRQWCRGQPSKTGVIDVSRQCNQKCKFCYYANEDEKKIHPIDALKKYAKQLHDNGRTAVDLTGGEPSLHPNIRELIDYCHELGMKVTMITNGQRELTFGADAYRLSLQGTEKVHDELTGVEGSYSRLIENARGIMAKNIPLFFNTTICKQNAENLEDLAKLSADFHPVTHSFINFLPYYGWSKVGTDDVQPRFSDWTGPMKKALDILVDAGIGANVRYAPFCVLRDYEKHVCGYMQNPFDPYEWLHQDMTPVDALVYGNENRINNCKMDNPACEICAVAPICNGPFRQYLNLYGYEELKPYVNMRAVTPQDVLHFRFRYDEVHHV